MKAVVRTTTQPALAAKAGAAAVRAPQAVGSRPAVEGAGQVKVAAAAVIATMTAPAVIATTPGAAAAVGMTATPAASQAAVGMTATPAAAAAVSQAAVGSIRTGVGILEMGHKQGRKQQGKESH
jgi:hypothetical protein